MATKDDRDALTQALWKKVLRNKIRVVAIINIRSRGVSFSTKNANEQAQLEIWKLVNDSVWTAIQTHQ